MAWLCLEAMGSKIWSILSLLPEAVIWIQINWNFQDITIFWKTNFSYNIVIYQNLVCSMLAKVTKTIDNYNVSSGLLYTELLSSYFKVIITM